MSEKRLNNSIFFVLFRYFFSSVGNLYHMTLLCQHIRKVSSYPTCTFYPTDRVNHKNLHSYSFLYNVWFYVYLHSAIFAKTPLLWNAVGLNFVQKLSYFFSEKFINGTLYEAYGEAEVIIAIVGLK